MARPRLDRGGFVALYGRFRRGKCVKVQILLNDQVVNTQLVSIESRNGDISMREVKRIALKAALEDRAITLGQSFKVSFRLFDVMGEPIEDP